MVAVLIYERGGELMIGAVVIAILVMAVCMRLFASSSGIGSVVLGAGVAATVLLVALAVFVEFGLRS
ncbi:MAG: hypothetical protein ACJAZO_001967 [Myxococcota bacterium]|jgi:hypothetical protein